uniref:Uncharacterized protein n=1 Tax=Thermogemmatispora argillosa TaxID=2045280 RepID=A0A455T8K4_9CHLR|nr:hypothetical protein KTA_39920 [Thermogemmatispora argillosa]
MAILSLWPSSRVSIIGNRHSAVSIKRHKKPDSLSNLSNPSSRKNVFSTSGGVVYCACLWQESS